MAYPKINTLTDIFQPDGFGFFGFGDGGFGGTYQLINPQWNTNSGSYGFDPYELKPYVEATNTPSYVGASLYDLSNSSFFAKITPAPPGSGSIQTGLLIRFDRHNYAEISYGPNGQFNAYISTNSDITVVSMPVYDSIDHAYWRIRNEDPVSIFFDTSPDGENWTEQGFAGFDWDITKVTVSIFAGFNELEASGNKAFITNVNTPANNLELSGSAGGVATVSGSYTITDPNALSGNVSAKADFRGAFVLTLGIPEGGLTDFAYAADIQAVDPLITTSWAFSNITAVNGATPITSNSWTTQNNPVSIPMPYRDGSYFQPAAYASISNTVAESPDNIPLLLTNVQLETTTGLGNRLPLTASLYTTGCAYSPGTGVTSVIRSTELALNGQYAGKVTSSTTAGTLGDGNFGYWLLPQSAALIPVIYDGFGTSEALFGSVYLSTTRANTTWFASFIFYDSSFNIIGATLQEATITNKNTHPGGGVWQQGVVSATSADTLGAAYVAVVPVVQTLSATPPSEVVYTSNNSITGASLSFSEEGTEYSHPRKASISVKADRVNYVMNSGFNLGITNWYQGNVGITGSPNSATMTWDSTTGYRSVGSLRMDLVVPSGTYTGGSNSKIGASTRAEFSGSSIPAIQGLKVGHTYTITAWIRQSLDCPDVLMDFKDANGLGLTGVSINTQKITNPENIEGNWTRLQTTYTVPPTGLSEYYMFFYIMFPELASAPFSFWIDSLMVEEAEGYQGYFDGAFSSSDYKWESGGVSNNSRSYYYKDYANKFLRLNVALPSVVPVGEDYELLFAQPIT